MVLVPDKVTAPAPSAPANILPCTMDNGFTVAAAPANTVPWKKVGVPSPITGAPGITQNTFFAWALPCRTTLPDVELRPAPADVERMINTASGLPPALSTRGPKVLLSP